MYCDEAADESAGVNVHQPTAFAHKLLQLSGVALFWEEFSASAKSSPVCSTAPVVRTTRQDKTPNANSSMFKRFKWGLLCLLGYGICVTEFASDLNEVMPTLQGF